MKKKIILMSLCALVLACTTVFGTLAYLNATADPQTNTFTVGDLAIDLTEEDWDAEAEHVIYPGATFDKTPEVTVTSSATENAWVMVGVTVTNADKWAEVLGEGYDLSTIFVGHDEAVWSLVKETADTYYYMTDAVVAEGSGVKIFTDFAIPTTLNEDDLAALGETFDIVIHAYAVQGDLSADLAKTQLLGMLPQA